MLKRLKRVPKNPIVGMNEALDCNNARGFVMFIAGFLGIATLSIFTIGQIAAWSTSPMVIRLTGVSIILMYIPNFYYYFKEEVDE